MEHSLPNKLYCLVKWVIRSATLAVLTTTITE